MGDVRSIDDMDDAELTAKRNQLQAEIAEIEVQLLDDKRDEEWRKSAKVALIRKRHASQAVHQRLRELHRDTKRAEMASEDRRFVRMAAKLLDPETYRRLWDAVKGDG